MQDDHQYDTPEQDEPISEPQASSEEATPESYRQRKLALMENVYRVPASPKEFLPPKPANLTTECRNYLEVHWPQCVNLLRSMSGEELPKHGHPQADFWKLTFDVQEDARQNGFALLGKVDAWTLRHGLMRGYKALTGTALGKLIAQAVHLQVEDQREARAKAAE